MTIALPQGHAGSKGVRCCSDLCMMTGTQEKAQVKAREVGGVNLSMLLLDAPRSNATFSGQLCGAELAQQAREGHPLKVLLMRLALGWSLGTWILGVLPRSSEEDSLPLNRHCKRHGLCGRPALPWGVWDFGPSRQGVPV